MNRFYLFFFLLFITNLPAQELYFSKSSAFQSLPSVETYQVLQDHNGFLWVTTDAGLCRYDGATLKTYTIKDGIPENVVLKAYEDHKGRIWFTTLSGYFFYYENEQFHQIAANAELKKLCSYYPISGFFIGEKDTLYCATSKTIALLKIAPQQNYKNIVQDEKGLKNVVRFFYSNKLNKSETIFSKGGAEPTPLAYSFLVNNNGEYTTFYYNRLYPDLGDTRRGCSDKYGNMYFSAGCELFAWKKSTGYIESCKLTGPLIFVSIDPDGDLWAGTTLDGGFLFKKAELKSKPVHFLGSLSVCSILVDREGSVWASTREKGVFKCNSKDVLLLNEKANYFQKDKNRLNIACHSNKIISLFKNDSMYVIEGFSKYVLPGQDMLCALIDDQYTYFNNGFSLYCYKGNNLDQAKEINVARNNEIFKIMNDTLVTASPKNFGILFNNKIVKRTDNPFPIKYSTQLKDNSILVSTRSSNGIYKFSGGRFVPFLSHLPQLKIRINCIVEDSAGNLWLATNEHGVYCYDSHHRFHVLDSTNVPTKINSLTLDRFSNLWACSNQELIKINYSKSLQKPIIQTFTPDNGIPDFQMERLIEFNGKIWCSSNESFFYFDTEKMHSNTISPLVYIKTVLINEQKFNPNNNMLNLDYTQNNIHIQSNAIAFKNTDKKNFLYQLIGYDNDWHSSATGDVQYTNLDHGNYRFVIYGINNDGKKSLTPATFTFTIKRPFWFTWWFILFEISIIVLIIYFIFRYWKNKIEKKEHEKTLVNQRIAEFKMTALRSQMNPHFIFNAIGSIQHYILKNKIKQSYDYLSKFSMLIRNILNNSRQEYISLHQEVTTLKLYIELEQIRFTHPFEFKIEIDEQLDMEMDIPTMLIQPYVENSIWHGLMPKESEGCLLELIFKQLNDTIRVTIRDNGIGRKPADPNKKNISRGMSITEQRIEALETTNEKKYITTINDLRDENGQVMGTEVTLIIPLEL